ncbi:DUF2179 domain-containing protein [Paradesulfitobacterium ferrireducens]|uniref:DUF2179 domain-containing protein n=1 Tax=Paradesulfitobacterium ferrireducens TaxID=2816476 RepID=UPI001A90C08C|nr:DUF5698 domain-containing protein [Paradesulfitobacterium ferrireducens]
MAAYPILSYFFIFFARIADVSLDVFRILLLARGYAIPAAVIGFFEICIYVVALSTVMAGGLNDFGRILVYAAGFASGNFIGSYIENRMAVGFVVIQVFPYPDHAEELVSKLRQVNYGVTVLTGEGRSGPREILVVTAKRKDQPRIITIINEVAPDTFFNISDVRSLHGGVFPNK